MFAPRPSKQRVVRLLRRETPAPTARDVPGRHKANSLTDKAVPDETPRFSSAKECVTECAAVVRRHISIEPLISRVVSKWVLLPRIAEGGGGDTAKLVPAVRRLCDTVFGALLDRGLPQGLFAGAAAALLMGVASAGLVAWRVRVRAGAA